MRNFGPVFVSRGVVQISAYVDTVLASLLAEGAVAALTNAQTIYMLPVSLFGMAVSAAELPAMSSALGSEAEIGRAICASRLNRGLRQIAFFIVPSAMAFLALGDVIAAVLFQTAASRSAIRDYVWANPRRVGGRTARVARWAGSTRPLTTRCATRARRCASP